MPDGSFIRYQRSIYFVYEIKRAFYAKPGGTAEVMTFVPVDITLVICCGRGPFYVEEIYFSIKFDIHGRR